MLRSGCYSDDIITNLVQRRFVAHMYDVAPPEQNHGDGSAYDRDAIAAIGDLDRLRQGRGGGGRQDPNGRVHADSYPTALFLSPEGELLGDGVWGVVPPERLLARIREVMAKWPQWFGPTDEERAVLAAAMDRPGEFAAVYAAARLQFELTEFEAALALARRANGLADGAASRARAAHLAGRALTCLHRCDEARAVLLTAERDAAPELQPAVQVALARLDLRAKAPEAALRRLMPLCTFAEPSESTGVVLYTAGLAAWRAGDEERAKRLWRQHRRELPLDRLARRSAASLGLEEAEAFRNQELLELEGWW